MKQEPGLKKRRTPFDRIPLLYDVAMWFASMAGPWALRDALGEVPAGRVLDVGGGTGMRTAKYIVPGRKAFVADLSGPMLRRAVDNYGFHGVLTRGEAMPFPENSFDAVFMIDMLHHASDPIGCVKDSARVLRPGGKIYILDFEAKNLAGKLVLAWEKALGFGSRFLPAAEYAAALESSGVKAEVRWLKSFEYLIIGSK